MTEKQATEKLIAYCEARIKETPDMKNGYYHNLKAKLKILLDDLD